MLRARVVGTAVVDGDGPKAAVDEAAATCVQGPAVAGAPAIRPEAAVCEDAAVVAAAAETASSVAALAAETVAGAAAAGAAR